MAIFQYYDQKGKIIGVSLCLRFAKIIKVSENCIDSTEWHKRCLPFLKLSKKYLREPLVFMWNSVATMAKVQFLFFRRFLLILAKLLFREEDWTLRNFEIFLIFPNFPRSVVIWQLLRQLVYTSLVPIETKICSTIKKSQDIINMIVTGSANNN